MIRLTRLDMRLFNVTAGTILAMPADMGLHCVYFK